MSLPCAWDAGQTTPFMTLAEGNRARPENTPAASATRCRTLSQPAVALVTLFKLRYYNFMARHTASDAEHSFALAVAKLVQARRGTLGWSQEGLARDAGMSVANVRRIESGNSPAASFVTIGRLARSLDLSLDELFTHFALEAQ